jgi:hypothetical protein
MKLVDVGTISHPHLIPLAGIHSIYRECKNKWILRSQANADIIINDDQYARLTRYATIQETYDKNNRPIFQPANPMF